jgi:heat shock protein HtpX
MRHPRFSRNLWLWIRLIAAMVPIFVIGGFAVAIVGAAAIGGVIENSGEYSPTVGWVLGLLLNVILAVFMLLIIVIAVQQVRPDTQKRRQALLKRLEAQEVGPSDAPALHGVLDRLCALADVPKPTVMVGAVNFPSAVTLGTTLCVTNHLLKLLTPKELDAVLAHELGHLVHEDERVMRVIGFVGEAGMSLPREVKRDLRALAFFPWILLGWMVYVSSLPMVMVASRAREFLADDFAVQLTRSPAQLASALIKLSAGHNAIPTRDLRKVAPSMALMCVDVNGTRRRYPLRAHPPLRRRLKRLGLAADLPKRNSPPPRPQESEPLERALARAGLTRETFSRPPNDPYWGELWRTVLAAPLIDAITMTRLFGDWRPDDPAGRALFDRLATADPQHVAAVREEFRRAVVTPVPVARRPGDVVGAVETSFSPSGSSLTVTAAIKECGQGPFRLLWSGPRAVSQHLVIELPGGHVTEESRAYVHPAPMPDRRRDSLEQRSPDGRFRVVLKRADDGAVLEVADGRLRPMLATLDAPMARARVSALRNTGRHVTPALADLLGLLADCLAYRSSQR